MRWLWIAAVLLVAWPAVAHGEQDFVALDEQERRAQQGDPDAMYGMSLPLQDGDGVKRDDKKQCHYLKLAAYRGHAVAMFGLANNYLGNSNMGGSPGCVKKSYSQAYLWGMLARRRWIPGERLYDHFGPQWVDDGSIIVEAAGHLTPEQRREIMREVEARASNPVWSPPG